MDNWEIFFSLQINFKNDLFLVYGYEMYFFYNYGDEGFFFIIESKCCVCIQENFISVQ